MNGVTVLVVTHGASGRSMIEAIEQLGGALPDVHPIAIEVGDSCEFIDQRIDQALAGSRGEPLFLLDLIGSTPARLCVQRCVERGVVLGGLNLAMLMKLTTADRSVGAARLAEELAASGKKSIFRPPVTK